MNQISVARGTSLMMSYERKLLALGKLLDRRTLRDVCVAEVPGGFVVSGLAPAEEREGAVWRSISFEVTDAELSGSGHATGAPVKRRWPF